MNIGAHDAGVAAHSSLEAGVEIGATSIRFSPEPSDVEASQYAPEVLEAYAKPRRIIRA